MISNLKVESFGPSATNFIMVLTCWFGRIILTALRARIASYAECISIHSVIAAPAQSRGLGWHTFHRARGLPREASGGSPLNRYIPADGFSTRSAIQNGNKLVCMGFALNGFGSTISLASMLRYLMRQMCVTGTRCSVFTFCMLEEAKIPKMRVFLI